MMEQSAYTDVTAACGAEKITMMDASDEATGPALCYVRNDLPTAFEGSVTVDAIHFATGAVTSLSSVKVSLPAGGGALGFFCAKGAASMSSGKPDCPTFQSIFDTAGCKGGAADCMLNVTVTSAEGEAVSRNVLPLGVPSALKLPATTIKHVVKSAAAGSQSVDIELTSTATAVYVWLSTLEQGRFSDNAFVLLPGVARTVSFQSFVAAGTSSAALTKSLRVEHLQQYCSREAGMDCH